MTELSKIISYCGLVCGNCAIYLATRETDKTKKEQIILDIIIKCKSYYGVDYKYEDINDCDGCKPGSGRLFFACNNCNIKKCAAGKGISNCAFCEEYACEELRATFKTESGAKARLDKIRNSL